MKIDLKQGDCLELMKELPDNSVDLIFCDPPYALGSEIIIRPDGKPDYKKAVDFMNKWDMPDGKFWQDWYKEAFRVLKYGGHCAMFGIDRQTFLFQYYAVLNGFQPKQSLYWYFISNFPKASDLSKNLDKHFGEERAIAYYYNAHLDGSKRKKTKGAGDFEGKNIKETKDGLIPKTAPSSELAKKYDGYKYSIAPLKQTCEEIMVFQKPYKNKSCLNDVLAYENGDSEITVGALDIDGNRVATSEDLGRLNKKDKGNFGVGNGASNFFNKPVSEQGRYPAQTFIDTGAGEAIDRQSGVSKSTGGGGSKFNGSTIYGGGIKNQIKKGKNGLGLGDTGGASRILHKCDYETTDFDLFNYCPKVSKSERNAGCEGLPLGEAPASARSKPAEGRQNPLGEPRANNHPTVKPTKLLSKILKLFKTPNKQVVLDPFMGSGSLGISAVDTGFDYIGYELDKDYFKIAKARIDNAKSKAEERLF